MNYTECQLLDKDSVYGTTVGTPNYNMAMVPKVLQRCLIQSLSHL